MRFMMLACVIVNTTLTSVNLSNQSYYAGAFGLFAALFCGFAFCKSEEK